MILLFSIYFWFQSQMISSTTRSQPVTFNQFLWLLIFCNLSYHLWSELLQDVLLSQVCFSHKLLYVLFFCFLNQRQFWAYTDLTSYWYSVSMLWLPRIKGCDREKHKWMCSLFSNTSSPVIMLSIIFNQVSLS